MSSEIIFWYKNYKGEEGYRRVTPISIRFGSSEWHKQPQWLMLGRDEEKEADREFAMADMKNFVGNTVVHFSRHQPRTPQDPERTK